MSTRCRVTERRVITGDSRSPLFIWHGVVSPVSMFRVSYDEVISAVSLQLYFHGVATEPSAAVRERIFRAVISYENKLCAKIRNAMRDRIERRTR